MRLSDRVHKGPSSIHGTGLFAKVPIESDTWIGTYQGPTATRNGMYVLWVTHEDGREEGRSGRNLLRYLNHAVPPNAWFDGFELYAGRDIEAGEELTIDYGWER